MEEKVSKSEIQSFFTNKIIFITGASGFMGKVLLEKLLYCCSDLDKIYILMRSKRGDCAETRLDDMFKLPLFQRMRNEKPQLFEKVIALNGDVCSPNLGLTDQQRELLIKETHVVFHFAATVRFNEKLKDAIEMNTTGTKKVLDLAKAMERLKSFVHLSTAFCHVDQEILGECTYNSPDDPEDIMRLVQLLDDKAIDLIMPKLLHSHPNTYTYSKCLAETLVTNEYPNLPCGIVRPSIVMPTYSEPIPGWVDNSHGPIGFIIGVGKGFVRSMLCNNEYNAELITVDNAINVVIATAYRIAIDQNKSKNIPVINITQGHIKKITWREMLELITYCCHKYPFERQLWYPGCNFSSSRFKHNLVLFFQIIPAYFIDFLMLMFQKERFMVRILRRILGGLEEVQYFTTRKWIFYNDNMHKAHNDLSPMDKQLFPILISDINMEEYFKNVILGTRQYVMKQDLSTLSKARRHQRIMYILHITVVYSFFGMLYFIYKNIRIVKVSQDYITNIIKSLSIIDGLLTKMHL